MCTRRGQGDKGDTGVAGGLLGLVWTAAEGAWLDAEPRGQEEARAMTHITSEAPICTGVSPPVN